MEIASSFEKPNSLIDYHAVIAPSNYALATFNNKICKSSKSFLSFIIPPVVDLSFFPTDFKDDKFQINSNPFVVGFIGRLVQNKSVGLFLLAAKVIQFYN